jgi:PLP dependent protein
MPLAVVEPATVAERLRGILEALAAGATRAQRNPKTVRLVAVSKFHGREAVEAALAAGQRHFGESRVQEAGTKWNDLRPLYPDLRLHLIGKLQTNKVKQALQVFDVIGVVDRDALARAIADHRGLARPGLELLIQVNVGREPQKGGVDPSEVDAFIDQCRKGYGLPVVGVLCIPPAAEDPAVHFAYMAELARRHGLAEISMGMSEDFEAAIGHGATQVRIGRALFGDRPAFGETGPGPLARTADLEVA